MQSIFREQFIQRLVQLAHDNPKPLIIGNRARTILAYFAVDKRRYDERKDVIFPYWLRALLP